ncbi:ShlB/FhaC/HecB family hemolysin secretion/activation protein [Herbaspirillum sp.]|uniref:ShlB/FhaC/HecB family hemolysin secretion/activation protein n=1 Tax=Herbaspirillum sp. TaxID=1890675 RepID=UPI0031D5C4EC
MTLFSHHGALRLLPLATSLVCAYSIHAQDLRNAAPPVVPPLAPAEAAAKESAPLSPLPAANEAIVLTTIKGIVLVPDTSPASLQRVVSGVDTTATPLAQSNAIGDYLRQAVGQSASLASLRRLADGISRLLHEQGRNFVSVWLPPQDLTNGVVRVVVRQAVMEGAMKVEGAEYFRPASYLTWIRQQPNALLDEAALQEDIDWINRNPFRNATLAAEAGSALDSTRLALRVREKRPLRIFAGVDNSGTKNTGEERIFTGFNWGNAFGRGDQLSYQFKADPDFHRSITHSLNYLTNLPWRHTLGFSGAWSKTTPDMGPLFNQTGTSWQLGTQYRIPLAAIRSEHVLLKQEFGADLDFKYADNNLDFATIPVVNNSTKIAQLSLLYTLNRETADNSSSLSPRLVLSPGGLLHDNRDAAFDGSRAGAPARYAYFRLDVEHSQNLPAKLRWNISANAQYANVPLLGSEMLAGAGAQAVRGYPESGAFGDSGLVLKNELHAPAWKVSDAQLDAFVFQDQAWLSTNGQGASNIHLSSIGVGIAMNWNPALTFNVTAAWPLKRDVGGEDGARALFRAQLAF